MTRRIRPQNPPKFWLFVVRRLVAIGRRTLQRMGPKDVGC